MYSINFCYTKRQDILEARQLLQPGDPEKLLIQVFCGIPDKTFVTSLRDELVEIFPQAQILGTTTAGEIVDGGSQDQSTVITLSQFEKTSVSTGIVLQNDDLYEAGSDLSEAVVGPKTKAVILFGCGIKNKGAINGEPLLAAFQDNYPRITIAGAQAGDNAQVVETFVFTKEDITSSGAAAAALSGDDLQVQTYSNLSWIPLGKEMTITRAEDTRIHTIDDQPASSVYRHYLGEKIGDKLPYSAAEFPLVVKRGGVQIARHANHVQEDGSLEFMAPFFTGEKVQFAFCHSGLVASSAREMFNTFATNKHEAIYIYSCLTRKWILGTDASTELAPLAKLAPTSGFFSYGEYFTGEGQNLFLSQTMTVIGLSENPQSISVETETQDSFPENESKTIEHLQALHRLVDTSAQERETLISELQDALTEIQTLRGFIPICASCKSIRDDKGYWKEIESYIEQHTMAQFSHGLCPDCTRKLYPFMEDYLKDYPKRKN